MIKAGKIPILGVAVYERLFCPNEEVYGDNEDVIIENTPLSHITFLRFGKNCTVKVDGQVYEVLPYPEAEYKVHNNKLTQCGALF